MLSDIGPMFKLLANGPPATVEEIEAMKQHFGVIPIEYLELVVEATEVELQHVHGQYIRIWGPNGCLEMDEGYGISQRLQESIPIGDDGGGQVIFYAKGSSGFGLYHVGYGNLDQEDAIWIAPSLKAFLTSALGVDSF